MSVDWLSWLVGGGMWLLGLLAAFPWHLEDILIVGLDCLVSLVGGRSVAWRWIWQTRPAQTHSVKRVSSLSVQTEINK